MDNNIKIKIINKLYPVNLFFENKLSNKNIKCIFHNDRNPSAIFYPNSNAIWCFTCKRFFYPVNYINKLKLNEDEIIEELKFLYKTDTLEQLEELYNNFKVEQIVKPKTEIYFKSPEKSIIDFANDYFNDPLNNQITEN